MGVVCRGRISKTKEDLVKPLRDCTTHLGKVEKITGCLQDCFEVVGDRITTNEKIEMFVSNDNNDNDDVESFHIISCHFMSYTGWASLLLQLIPYHAGIG